MRLKKIFLFTIFIVAVLLSGCSKSEPTKEDLIEICKKDIIKIGNEYDQIEKTSGLLKVGDMTSPTQYEIIKRSFDDKKAIDKRAGEKLAEMEKLIDKDEKMLKDKEALKKELDNKANNASKVIIDNASRMAEAIFLDFEQKSQKMENTINVIFQNDYNYKDINKINFYKKEKEDFKSLMSRSNNILKLKDILTECTGDAKKSNIFERYLQLRSGIENIINTRDRDIELSRYARNAAMNEISKYFNISQIVDSSIVNKDNYGRYLVSVTIQGKNYFGVLVTNTYVVIVYDVNEKTYSYIPNFSYAEIKDTYYLKEINNWNRPIKR